MKSEQKDKEQQLESAAKKYAKEKLASIRKIKGLRGSTMLYYAFKTGAEWQRFVK